MRERGWARLTGIARRTARPRLAARSSRWRIAGAAALILAGLAAGAVMLSPGGVEATSGTEAGAIVGKYGDRALCPGQNDHQIYAGEYVRTGTTITVRHKDNNNWYVGCTAGNVLTYYSGSERANRKVNGSWLIELRTAAGSGGQLISGAHITLPAGFSGARATGVINSRNGNAGGGGSDGDWPHALDWAPTQSQNAQVYVNADITFTVPDSHSGDVYLRISAGGESVTSKPYFAVENFSFRFSPPLIDAYPLVAPLDSSGDPEEGDLSGGFSRPAGGTLQRARLFLREREVQSYVASDAGLASEDFGSATLKVTSDAAGATAIADATISQSDGSSALSACTETAAGDTCTITSANWPATGGVTDGLDVWFTVPAAHTGTAYLVLSVADTGLDPRRFAAGFFNTVVPVHPLAAPQNSGGTITTGTLSNASRSWKAGGGNQRAAVFLRDADPSDEYDSSDTNVARADFDSARIAISSDPGGTRPIEGAQIGSAVHATTGAVTTAIGACTETDAGPLCTIAAGSYPQDSATPPKTEKVDIYFTVPDTHDGDAYVSVTAIKAGNAARSHWLEYDAPAQVSVYPLAAPAPSGSPVTWDIARSARRFAASAGRQQVRVFLRSAEHGDLYESGDANVADSVFDEVEIRVTADAAGTMGVTGAKISDSSGTVLSECEESAAGNLCTVPSADWPDTSGTTNHFDIWFAAPSTRNDPAYLTVTVKKSGNRARSYAVKYDPRSRYGYAGTWAITNGGTTGCSTANVHQVVAAGAYKRGATTTVLLNPRRAGISAVNCAAQAASEGGTWNGTRDAMFYAEGLGWKLAVNHGPGDGTPISGAHIDLITNFAPGASPYTGVGTPRSGSAINPRNFAEDGVVWPWRNGHTGSSGNNFSASLHAHWGYAKNVTMSFTVPRGHTGPVYLYAWKHASCRKAAQTADCFGLSRGIRPIQETTFVFQPGVGANPLPVPLSDAGVEEAGDLAEGSRAWAADGGARRVRVYPRAVETGEYTASDANAARGDFDTITIRVATADGGSTSVTGAKISSDAAGNTAIAACNEAAAGPVCTIPSSAWPQASSGTPRLALPQDLYFSVPASASGSVWLVVEAAKTGTGASKTAYSLEFGDPYIAAFPFLAPAPGGTPEAGNVQTNARLYAADAAANRAKAYLRAAAHMDEVGSGLTNAADDVFTSAVLRVATDASGATSVTGAKIAQADGSTALTACTENVAGPVCTITASAWPDTSGTTDELDLWFTVPTTVTTPVWLTITLSHTGKTDRTYAIRYDQPLAAYPLPVPQDSGGTLSLDLLSATQLRPTGGTLQRARVFLRSADHDDHYVAAHTNIASSGLDSAVIKLTSDRAGANAISGATITQSDGSSALAACTENTAGNTCTVTSANWPATGGTTTGLDIWFTVPSSHAGTAYLHVTATKSGRGDGTFALEYGNPVAVFPLPVPQSSTGTPSTEQLRTTLRRFAAAGATQRAGIYLRDASRTAYDASHANAGRSGFDQVVIRVASDAAGQNAISGAKIASNAAGTTVIAACTETAVGPTCTIPSGSWGQDSATPPKTTVQNIHFSLPSGHASAAYLVVTVSKSGSGPRSFALKYELPLIAVHPLVAPHGLSSGATVADARRAFAEAGSDVNFTRGYVMLRAAAHSGVFTSTDANVERSGFDQVVLQISADAAGTIPITGAEIASNQAGTTAIAACSEGAVGPTCTIASASWPQATSGTPLRTLTQGLYLRLPAGRTAPAYLTATATKAGFAARTGSFRFLPRPQAWAQAVPRDAGGALPPAGSVSGWRPLADNGETQRVSVFIRSENRGDDWDPAHANAAKSAFDSVRIQVTQQFTADDASVGITGAKISSDSAGNTALAGCTEGTTPGNTCTIAVSDWPGTGTSGRLDLYFSAPASHLDRVLLAVSVGRDGDWHPRVIRLWYRPGVAVHPLPVPPGTAAGTNLAGGGRDFSRTASNQATVHLRAADPGARFNAGDANAARSAFDTVRIRIASDAAGSAGLAGAKLAANAAGTTALTGCSEGSTPGHTCTVPSASWPQTTGGSPTTTGLALHMVLPDGHVGTFYLVVTSSKSGLSDRVFALEYGDPEVEAAPLVVPATSAGGILSAFTETDLTALSDHVWTTGGGANYASVFLRAAPHGNEYDAADADAERAKFDRVRIRLATDAAGATEAAGLQLTKPDGTALTVCTEASAGPTCTVASADWPDSSGDAGVLRLRFGVTDAQHVNSTIYLVATAEKSGQADRVFALEYLTPNVQAFPLVVPLAADGTTLLSANLLTTARAFQDAGRSQRVRVFVRDAPHSDTYVDGALNAPRADFSNIKIEVGTKPGGNFALLAGAKLSKDAAGTMALDDCTEGTTAGNICTILAANWPQGTSGSPLPTLPLDVYFSVPDATPDHVFVRVEANVSGYSRQQFDLEYEPFLQIWPLAVPNPVGGTRESGDVKAGTRAFATGGGRSRVELYLRDSSHGNAYSATGTLSPLTDFDTVKVRIATAEDGDADVAGALISDAGGAAVGACEETAPGPLCTIGRTSWPAGTGGLSARQDVHVSVPVDHGAAAWLVLTVEKTGEAPRVFSIKYDDPYVAAHPLPVPHGSAAGYDASAGAGNFAAGGDGNRVSVYLRSAAHGGTLAAAGTNARDDAFSQVVIKITSDAAGMTQISGAKISSDAAGNTALSACTETSVGGTCTITAANWPDTGNVTDPLHFYFSVPDGTSSNAYVHVNVVGLSGETNRSFALRYDPGLTVYPLVVPSGVSSGDAVTGARQFATGGARQGASVYLRDVWHSNTFTSGDANVERSEFDSVTIRLATDAAGTAAAEGPQIYGAGSGPGRPSGCVMTDGGATCTIQSASWPQASSGTPLRTQGLDLYFSAPGDFIRDVHVVVTVRKSGELPRRFSLKYDNPLAPVFPLAVPAPGGTEETGGLKAPARSFAAGGGAQRMRVYLRSANHDDEYDADDVNARDDAFTEVVIRVATSSAGTTAVSGAKISSDAAGSTAITACTENTVGGTCTITAANWPDTGNVTDALDLYWSVPDATNAPAYLVVTVKQTGKGDRAFWLRYDPGLPVFPLIVPDGVSSGGTVVAARQFAAGGARQRATVHLRDAAHSNTYTSTDANAERSEFGSVVIRLATDAAGATAAEGGQIYGSASGTGRPSGCVMSDGGATCTIQAGSWAQDSGTPPRTQGLDLHFSMPDDATADVHLVVSVKKPGEPDRVFALEYEAPLAPVFPLAVPEDAVGNLEPGDVTAPSRTAARGGGQQRARIFLRAAAHANAYDASHGNAARALFSTATIRIATSNTGATEVAGALITSDGSSAISNCTEAAAGPTCTINGGTATMNVWPIDAGNLAEHLDIYWSVPDATTSDAYLVVTVSAAGKADRVFWLRYRANLPIFPLAMPSGTADGTDVSAGTREYAPAGAGQQVEINLRGAAHSGTYTASDANAARNLFDSVLIRVATDAAGNNEATGARIAGNAAGTAAFSNCTESTPGPSCTIARASWPGTTTTALSPWITVPASLGADAYLVVQVRRSGQDSRVFALKYDDPYLKAHPLAAPIVGGTPESGDLAATVRSFAAEGARQQVRVYLRGGWHGNEYDAADANAADAAFQQLTIRIASAAGGSSNVSGAAIYGASSGSGAVAACTEATAGPLCTITAANLPDAADGTNAPLDFWFSVPDSTPNPGAFVVVTASHATLDSRVFSLRYKPGLPVFPVTVPRTSSDGYETGNLGSRTGAFAGNNGRQKATVFLRDASPGNMYDAGDTNVDQSDSSLFDSVTLTIATTADGGTAISGARFYGGSGGNAGLRGCSGNVCTITRANWPSSGGLDLWFSVPDSRTEDAFLHVAVNKSGEPSREAATRYESSYVRAYQLVVPKTGASTYTSLAQARRWQPEGGDQRVGVFLREQPRSTYDAAHANAPAANVDSAVIKITSDAGGASPLSGAEITSDGSAVLSACTESAAGHTCTIPVADWPQSGSPALATELDFQFSAPDSHRGDVYVHVTLIKSGKTNRTGSLRWQAPLSVSAFPRPRALNAGGTVMPSAGEFDAKAGTDRARVELRSSAGGSGGASTSAFDRVIITVASDAAGSSPISGAKLSSDAAGSTVITECTETSVGHTCTVPVADWPKTGAVANNLGLYFSVPLTHGAAAYLVARAENAGERDRVAALKYDAPIGSLSSDASPVLDPRLSGGEREQDDDGDGAWLDNLRWYDTAAGSRQRLAVRIYKGRRTDWSGTDELASFASLASSNALVLSASYPTGPLTSTGLGTAHIEFTKPDGTALGCSEASYAGGNCTLTRATLKTLMGVGGAADARRSFELEFAFSIKTAFTNSADVTVRAEVNRHVASSGWSTIVYARGITAAAANAQPFAMQLQADGSPEQGNVLTRDPQRRYAPGGQDTPVNLRIYASSSALDTYSSSVNLVPYASVEEIKLEIKDRPSPNALIADAAITVQKNDGTSACTEPAAGNVCTITGANFLASGPPRAAGYYRALPLDFTFTVPAGYVNADFGNADLVISVRRGGSGTPAARTQTFTLPFDGGTRAQPFAMASNPAYSAAAGNQQWAAGGRRTPVWLHIYNTEKSAFEAVAANNTAQYWEFDQTAGAEVITIELLDGQNGEAAPRRARITAPDSDEKFAPCAESRPGPVCTISLAALKAYDSGATTDDDYVDPLRFAVSVPQGSTASIRIRAGVQRSDDVPGSNPAVKERKVREFALYAPWPYPQLVPLDDDGEPPAGSIGLVPWEYEPRGQRTPLLLGLYNERRAGAYAEPSSANQPALSDFETITLTVLDRGGAPLADARITARSGAPLSACRPAGNECEISRAEWRALQPGGGSLVRAPLEFAVIVPAAYGEAISVRAVIRHSGRNAPDSALPSGLFTVGSAAVGIADDSGARSTSYRLSMVSPVKKAFALPLLDDGEGGLRVCAKDEPGAACTAPSAQRGAALGFAAAITRGLDSHPAKPDPDRDELVQYDEVESLRITAMGGRIIHRALCPARDPEHPVDPAQPATADDDCTVPGALLQAFHGAEPSDPIRPLELVVVPSAASGAVSLAYDIAGSDDVIEATMAFTAAAGTPRLAAAVFFDWTDPGSDYDAARPAVLFTVGRRDSRAAAPPVPASALPGRLVPARFDELDTEAALQLSISQGTLSYNGVACPDPDACTLPLSRAELLAGSSAADDSEEIGSLRAEYALPLERSGPTTLTAAARPDGGSPVSGSLAIPHPAVSAPVGAAHLPADADGEISAGATEQLAAGFLIAVADSGAGWACLRPDPSFLELDASGAAVDACALSRAPAPAEPSDPQPAPSALHAWLDDDSYLALGGDAVFSGDGGKKLEIGGSSRWNQLRCAPAEGLPGGAGADAGPRDLACWVTDAAGARPEITAAASTSGAPITVSANLISANGRKFHFILGSGEQPSVQPAARGAAAAAFALPGSVFGSAAIPVGAAAIPASASLLRAGDATGPIPDGAAAALLLRIADAGGRPADPERISSITLTASKGELGGDYCDGGRACTFQARAGSALASAAAEDPGLTARIPLTLTPPDGEGSLTLRAVVVSTAGAQFSAALPLDYAGGAALIRIGEDLPVLHHHATTDAADNAGGAASSGSGSANGGAGNGGSANGNGAAGDPAVERGIAEIPITATDAGGRVVELPPRASARVQGPDGATEDRFAIARDCSDGPAACKFRISVTASAADPLPSGRYVLIVAGAGLTDAQGNADIRAEFGVAGPAAAIEARAPALPAIGAPLAIRADLTDAQGNAVADGTRVRLSVRSPDGSPSPLIPLDPPPTDPADPASALLRTRNGIAAASMAAASASVAILSLDAQDGPRTAASLTLVLTPDSGAGAGSDGAAGSGAAGGGATGAPAIQIGFSTWSGRMGASAAAALAASPTTQAIYLWNGKRWLRYAATPSGTPVPGSQNFTLAPNDVIYTPSP